MGMEALVGRHVGDLDLEDVVVAAGYVVGGLHFGQLHDGPFECLHIGAGMARTRRKLRRYGDCSSASPRVPAPRIENPGGVLPGYPSMSLLASRRERDDRSLAAA